PVIARGRRKRCEVTGQHGRGRHIRKYFRWSAACFRSLKTSKEEKLVLHYRSADRAAVLIALQGVSCRRKRIPRIEDSISHKFKKVAVKFVRSGFRHEADFAGGLSTLLRSGRAGLDLEFLHCIRKWHRQVGTLEGVVVVGAIELVTQTGI